MILSCSKKVISSLWSIPLGYSYHLATNISSIKEEWDSLTPQDEYWSSDYHQALEFALPENLYPFYVTVYENNTPIGLIYLQWKKINLRESIKVDGNNFFAIIKRGLLSFLKNNTLVIGNLLLTGKYGFHFNRKLPIIHQFEIVNQIAESVCNQLKSKASFGTILIKDFFEEEVMEVNEFNNFIKFSVQPNMMMNVRDNWKTIENYSEDLKSKARIRYRRTLGKLPPLTSKELTYDEVLKYKKTLRNQYLTIANNASFNLFFLSEDYFPNLKKYLGDKIKIIAYFNQEGIMKGFYSIVKNYDHLDAHFLGYDADCNKENLLYLNMLFDMVSQGINLHVNKICMSRTAVEIKSSVGASPLKMICYLKHRNYQLNKLVRPIINYLYKDEEWIERSPFK